MKSYILKPKSVKISQIKEQKSFSIKDFFNIKLNEGKLLKSFLKKSYINSNIESGYYYEKSNYFLVGNRALNDNILPNEKEFIGVTPKGFQTKNKCVIEKGDVLIGNNGTLGQISFIKNNFNGITNSNITLLRFNKIKPIYYFIGIFYTSYFKNYCSVISTKSGTQEFITRDSLENIKIPFPTKNNSENPENIEKLVSLITQNIINKEEQIKLKNEKIDELIEKELLENQNPEGKIYTFPKISEIKESLRIDTGLYEKKFKNLYNKIQNYSHGTNKINELGFQTKKGPNLAISVIGESIYSNEKINNKFKQLILSKHVTEEGGIKTKQYIGSNVNLPVLDQYDFMLFARGDIGRVLLIDDFLVGATSNFDVFFITSKLPYYKNIFLLNYFKYLKSINFWSYFGVGGSGAQSLTDYFLKKLDIPNFPEIKQQEIAKEYYNKVEKNSDLNLDNYLQKEFERNSKLGIFQLNIELFELKEKLEDIIDKIIMDEKIDIYF